MPAREYPVRREERGDWGKGGLIDYIYERTGQDRGRYYDQMLPTYVSGPENL